MWVSPDAVLATTGSTVERIPNKTGRQMLRNRLQRVGKAGRPGEWGASPLRLGPSSGRNGGRKRATTGLGITESGGECTEHLNRDIGRSRNTIALSCVDPTSDRLHDPQTDRDLDPALARPGGIGSHMDAGAFVLRVGCCRRDCIGPLRNASACRAMRQPARSSARMLHRCSGVCLRHRTGSRTPAGSDGPAPQPR